MHEQIEIQTKKKHEFYFILFYFLTHIFLLYWMWQSHAFHSPLLLFFHCLWFACQEELLFLLLLPVSRKWVIYDFTCVKDAVSLFKKNNKPKNRMFAILMTAKNIFFWTLKLCNRKYSISCHQQPGRPAGHPRLVSRGYPYPGCCMNSPGAWPGASSWS